MTLSIIFIQTMCRCKDMSFVDNRSWTEVCAFTPSQSCQILPVAWILYHSAILDLTLWNTSCCRPDMVKICDKLLKVHQPKYEYNKPRCLCLKNKKCAISYCYWVFHWLLKMNWRMLFKIYYDGQLKVTLTLICSISSDLWPSPVTFCICQGHFHFIQ